MARRPRRHHPEAAPSLSRREMLLRAGGGLGAWALLDLLKRDGVHAAARGRPENPLAPKAPHFPARAKHVISLFMQGGPSHIDTFDPKPILAQRHGQPLPPSVTKGLQLQFTKNDAAILGSPQTFTKCGRSGLEIADTYPHLQSCADDLAVVRSCYHDSFNHAPAQYMLNTGHNRMGRPCLGSWVTYGLGSEAEDLPAFVVMATTGDTKGGPPVYDHGFLPGTYQPTVLRNAGSPVLYLGEGEGPAGGGSGRRAVIDMAQWLNREHRAARGEGVDDLTSRIASYELAFRMQSAVPEAVDLGRETRGDQGPLRAGRPDLGEVRGRLPDRPAAGRAGRPVRPDLHRQRRGRRLGQRPRRERQDAPADGPAHRRADRRPAEGPEGPWAARRDAGDLGRRVRPDAGGRRPLPGQAGRAGTTTRTGSPPGWPAGASRGAG